MSNVIDLNEWRLAKLGVRNPRPILWPRQSPLPRRRGSKRPTVSDLSAELRRKLLQSLEE